MAKQVKRFDLIEEGTNKVVPVQVKTTTKRFFDNLIEDYYRLGCFDTTNVRVVPVQKGSVDR